ncbi:MAG: T9SS type A sorting domain-containing protein [Bacteroidia bacterium]
MFKLLKCGISFFLTLASACLFAIEPPQINSPKDGVSNYSVTSLNVSCSLSYKTNLLRVELDTSPNFNSPILVDKFGTAGKSSVVLYPPQWLNQKFYIRAKEYNSEKTQESNWSETVSYITMGSTLFNHTSITNTDELKYWFSPGSGVSIQMILDTTRKMNSPYKKTYTLKSSDRLYVPLNLKQYYFVYRTLTSNDTSSWGDMDSFYSDFKQVITVQSGCISTGKAICHFTFQSPFQYSKYYTYHLELFEDPTLKDKVLDTMVFTTTSAVSIQRPDCRPLYVKSTIKGQFDSATQTFYLSTCNDAVKVTPFYSNTGKFQFKYDDCTKIINVEFDTSPSFDSKNLFKFIYNPNHLVWSELVEINFPKDPLNYYWRYKSANDFSESDWQENGMMFRYTIKWQTSGTEFDTNSSNMTVNVFPYYPPQLKYNHVYEFCLDTSAQFNSQKLLRYKVSSLNNSNEWSPVGIYYSSFNYIKMRMISPTDSLEYTPTLTKASHNSTNVSLSPNSVYLYPNLLPLASPTDVQIEISPTLNFDRDRIRTDTFLKIVEADTDYWMRMRAVNPLDTSFWIDTVAYRMENVSYVLEPRLIFPPDSSNNIKADSITFRWHNRVSDNADYYLFQIYENEENFKTLRYTNKLYGNIEELTITGLKPNRTYLWYVDAMSKKYSSLSWLSPVSKYTFNTSTRVNIQPHEPFWVNTTPNPASNELFVSISNDIIEEVHIFDFLGNEMAVNPRVLDGRIDITSFKDGIYIIRLSSRTGKQFTKTFVKINDQ